jgi:hypothetical protein
MDQRQLEELARDIEDLKRSIKRNSPLLHEAFDMKGWDLFSLIAGILISAFALGAHVLSATYGGFDHIPPVWQAILWAVLAIAVVGSGVVKILLFTRLDARGGSLGKVMKSFLAGNAKHTHLPYLALLVLAVSFVAQTGHPWYALPSGVLLMGLWCNVIVMQTGMKHMLALGYWGLASGSLALFWVESAPFLWVFITFGGMFFVFAGAIRLGRRPRNPGPAMERREEP